MEPLWNRVDRNRLKLLAFVALFVTASVAGADLVLAAPVALLMLRSARSWAEVRGGVGSVLCIVSLVTGVSATAWAGYTVLRSEKWLLRRLGATLVPHGEALDTKYALKDIAIAAGLAIAPALYHLDVSGTNAFVFAARRRRPVIGVTKGFITKLTIDEQRAVFANLVARIVSGDTIVSTGVTALMWPVHRWREYRLTVDDTKQVWEMAEYTEQSGGSSWSRSNGAVGVALLLFYVVGFAILAEVVAAGHRHALLTTAEKADAEGMLLLKDPAAMLSALTRCVELGNVVPSAGESFAELFYCWTGISTNDDDDPEWRRVSRLREVLGVMGHRDEESERWPDVGPPPAPRLG
jgi:Zn-dependent protease with chaperone function